MAGAMFNPDNYDQFPQYTAGGLLRNDDGGEWVYCKAASDISASYCCGWQAAFEATLIDVAQSTSFDRAYFAGFPRIAIPSGYYGWFQVRGIGRMRVSANMSAGAFPYTTTSSTTLPKGQLDDSASGQHRVRTCATLEDRGSSAGLVAAMFNYPGGDRIV